MKMLRSGSVDTGKGQTGEAGRRGGILVSLIVILLLGGLLAGSLVSLSRGGQETELAFPSGQQAYLAAETGTRYSRRQICVEGDDWSLPRQLQFMDGTRVNLVAGADGSSVLATAVAGPGGRMEAHAMEMAQLPEDCGGGNGGVTGEAPQDYVAFGGSEVNVSSGSEIVGDIYGDSVEIHPAQVRIDGNIVAREEIELGSGTEVTGFLCALDGDIELKASNIIIGGDIRAYGDVELGSGTTVLGSIYATGEVELKNSNCYVGGDIHAGEGVAIGSRSEVAGNIFSGVEVVIRFNNAVIGGDIHAMDSAEIKGATIEGDVVSGYDIALRQTVVGGSLSAGNEIECKGCSVSGTAYAGGGTNEVENDKVYVNVPPRELPQAPEEPTGCPTLPPPPPLQSFSAGGPDVEIGQNEERRLAPGSYGDVEMSGGGTMVLEAGDCGTPGEPGCYRMKEFEGDSWGHELRLDFSTGDSIHVFVERDASYTGPILVSEDGVHYQRLDELTVEKAKELARRVYWEVHGEFKIGNNTANANRQWFGTLLAEGEIEGPSNSYVVGLLASRTAEVNLESSNGTLIFVPADFAVENWGP